MSTISLDLQQHADGSVVLYLKKNDRVVGSLHGSSVSEYMQSMAIMHAIAMLIEKADSVDDIPDTFELDI